MSQGVPLGVVQMYPSSSRSLMMFFRRFLPISPPNLGHPGKPQIVSGCHCNPQLVSWRHWLSHYCYNWVLFPISNGIVGIPTPKLANNDYTLVSQVGVN